MTEMELYKKSMREIGFDKYENLSNDEIRKKQYEDVDFFAKLIYNLGFDMVNISFSTKEEVNTKYDNKYDCAVFFIAFKYDADEATLILPFNNYYKILDDDTSINDAKDIVLYIMDNMMCGFRSVILPKYGETETENIINSIKKRAIERGTTYENSEI